MYSKSHEFSLCKFHECLYVRSPWIIDCPQKRLRGFSGGARLRKSCGACGVRSLPRESLDLDSVESSYMAPLRSNGAKHCGGPGENNMVKSMLIDIGSPKKVESSKFSKFILR